MILVRHHHARCTPRPTATGGAAPPQSARAFTLLELMLALAIFAMVLTAIYSTWTAILRSARAGNDVAASAQRGRIASRTVEDALLSAVMFQANAPLYTFDTDTSGDFAALSLVARLPSSFPGSGYFGDLVVRRVVFSVEQAADGTNDLILRQLPILAAETPKEKEHMIVLARDVRLFSLEFLAPPGLPVRSRNGEWLTEWQFTNALPWVVRFTLGFGGATDSQGKPKDLFVRTVLLPSIAVPIAASQSPAVMGQPGAAPAGQDPAAGLPLGSGTRPDSSARFRPGQLPGG